MEVKLHHSVCFNHENNFYTFGGGLVTKLCLTLVTPWNVACQAPLSMGFSRQKYWSGLLFPSPGDLPDPGIEPRSPALKTDSLATEQQGKPLVYIFNEQALFNNELKSVMIIKKLPQTKVQDQTTSQLSSNI